MYKIFRAITIFLVIMVIALTSAVLVLLYFLSQPHDMPKRKPFETQYTIGEHIERISLETEKRFTEFINSDDFHSYSVEILYSFAGYPEFFMVEFAYQGNVQLGIDVSDRIFYNYTIGFIEYDEYYIGLSFSDSYDNWVFVDGKEFVGAQNPYSKNGVLNTRKYFGYDSTFAYEIDEEIIVIKSNQFIEDKNVIDKSEYEMYNSVRKKDVKEYYDGD